MNILSFLDETRDYTGKVLLLDHYMGVGDSLWRTCLHREIKRRFKGLELYVSSMGNYWKELYKTNPYIDKLVDRIGQPPYISGVDYYISDQKCPHVISDYARKLDALDALEIWSGLEIRDKSYVYEVLPEEQEWADKFLSKFPKQIVAISLKSSTWVRTLSPEKVIKIIQILRYSGCTVVVIDNQQFGYKDEGIINLAGGYSIREVASIMSKVNLHICPDSGLMHFSCFFKIPTIAIFGGSDPSCRLKYYTTAYPILAKERLDCQFCWSHSYMCPRGITPSPCLEAVEVDDIFEIVRQIL